MKRAFRYRLYPNRKQEAKMLRALEATQKLGNDALEHRKARWQNYRHATSYNLQARILTAERRQDALLGGLHSQVGQDVLKRLDRAFKAFNEHRGGYPKYKKNTWYGSFTYPQAYNGSVKPDFVRNRLFLSKVGNVPVVFHRPLPKDSRLKTCTIARERDGKWFSSLVFEEIVPLQNIQVPYEFNLKRPVGIDLGLLSLIATSDGEKIERPRFLRKAEKRLKSLQRTTSRKRKASKNQAKARRRVASLYSHVKRQRLDFSHKVSVGLVKEHGFIAFEDLRIENLVKNPKLARSIHDAGWGRLVKLTEYKAIQAGSIVVRVPAAHSTQECSQCGMLNKVTLAIRAFECCGCRRFVDRDTNAAEIVLKRGLAIAGLTSKVGQDMPKLKPVETRPLPPKSSGGVSHVEEAGTTCPEGLEPCGLSRGRMSPTLPPRTG